MPTFEIPIGPITIEVAQSSDPKSAAQAEGSAEFAITNKSTDTCAGRLSVQVAGQSRSEWFSIEGERERTFAAGETQVATIEVSIPTGVAAGDYPFRLRVAAVKDPDNDGAEGPVTTVRLIAPPLASAGDLPLILSAIGALASLVSAIGTMSTMMLGWRKEKLEALDFERRNEELEANASDRPGGRS